MVELNENNDIKRHSEIMKIRYKINLKINLDWELKKNKKFGKLRILKEKSFQIFLKLKYEIFSKFSKILKFLNGFCGKIRFLNWF